MTANTSPIFTLTPDVSVNNGTTNAATLTTATGDYTGVSGNHALVHTAGANGSYVRRLRFKAIGTNIASVARIYLNNGSTAGTAANNAFFGEANLPATTASNNSGTVDMDYVMEFALPASWRIYVGLGTTVAAGWTCVTIAGQY
jgi:hypothetical protein